MFGSLPANAHNSQEASSLDHGFVESYLNGDVTSGLIKSFIQEAVSSAEAAPFSMNV